MKKNYSVSAVLAVYNEAQTIEKSIKKINSLLEDNFKAYEIIIIESGSTDGTYEKSEFLKKKNSKIFVYHEGIRKGFGSALTLGIKKSKKDYIWPLDIDIPYPINTLLRALPYLLKYDCVLSYRATDNRGVHRKIMSFFYNFIVKIFLPTDIKHINSNFRVFKANVLKKMTFISKGWFIEAELAYYIKKKHVSYIELPTKLIDRTVGKSKVEITDILKLLKELVYFLKKN